MRRDQSKEARFEVLKLRLLLRRLNQVHNPECHPFIIREAYRAAGLAFCTPVPSLVFPCLFEELASQAIERHQARAGHYWRTFTQTQPAHAP